MNPFKDDDKDLSSCFDDDRELEVILLSKSQDPSNYFWRITEWGRRGSSEPKAFGDLADSYIAPAMITWISASLRSSDRPSSSGQLSIGTEAYLGGIRLNHVGRVDRDQ